VHYRKRRRIRRRCTSIYYCPVLLFCQYTHAIVFRYMADKLFYCDTCGVHLTGPQPALQHYSGSKHRKKEAAARSSVAFSASVAGLTADSSVPESSSGLEGPTVSLNLPSSASGCSDDWMKCGGNVSKSVETAPSARSVVMVQPLNPDLPPVPVTMTQNVLPQTEYDFDGISGWCYLCDTQLSSQQNADQHLSGQKHSKAKKRWEARREQLRMTVSGFPFSMKSKPIAMCQPQRCEMPTKDCIADIVAKYNSSRPGLPVTATASAAESAGVVDGMQWFNKNMKTLEMLQLHQRSDTHLKKVERQQTGGVPGDNTVWHWCPTCHKKMNSTTQLEIHMNSHSRQSSPSLACPEGRTLPPVATSGVVQWHHCDVCNKHVNTAAELELHRKSPAHQRKAALRDNPLTGNIGDNTVWQKCPVCAKRLNFSKQLDIHMNSHGPAARSLLTNTPRGDAVEAVYTEKKIISTADTSRMLEALNVPVLSAAEKIDPRIEFADIVYVKNLTIGDVDQPQGEETSQDDVEMTPESFEIPRSTDVSQPQKRNDGHKLSDSLTSQTASRAELDSSAAAAATAAAADDDDAVRMLKTSDDLELATDEEQQTFLVNQVSETTRPADINSLAAADGGESGDDVADDYNDNDDGKLIADDDLITCGNCASVGCVYHCELCDVHLSGDEPRTMHLTGSKHSACRQKAAEVTTLADQNPYSPNFRYCCLLCNVPFNTLKDKRQHERGQQHLSKSVRLPAPQRQLPDVVLPTDADNDNCLPKSLVASKPRSYQEELYFKALVADSICFLPTGLMEESQ